MFRADLERSFGKLILNHPIVTVIGTVALLVVGFRGIAASLEPDASQMLVLVQPTWRHLFAFALMIYGVLPLVVWLAVRSRAVAEPEQ